MNEGNDSSASLMSWPFLTCCAAATAGLAMVVKTTYAMGSNSRDIGGQNYQKAFWTLMSALFLILSTVAFIKVVD